MKQLGTRPLSIRVTDPFWTKYFQVVKDVMLPFQWDILHDRASITIESEREDVNIPTEKSHVIENFKIAAGQKDGNHYGWLFQDSDLYKWIEAAANSYHLKPDGRLLLMMDQCVDLIEAAQDEDGYLSTFYQIEAPELKFRRLFQSHELYCAGHLIEAAVAYAKATGSHRLLDVAERFVTCIESSFGPEEGKINGADGHQEIELALVHLYEYTGDERYLSLSHYFLQIRGQDPDFYEKQWKENQARGLETGPAPIINLVYHQAHKPVYEQTEAQGHAVRLVYMAQAMAGTARHVGDEKLLAAAEALWHNIVEKRMYVTGGIGSTVRGEAFTFDYDLPTDLMYCETCAAIGLLNFTHELQQSENKLAYAEVMERILYNSMISGMSLDGKHFFYVNPLEVDPEASQKNPDKSHVKATRPSWFGCACCPPNLARTIPALHRYLYQENEEQNILYINQWIDSDYSSKEMKMTQKHDWNAQVSTFIIHNSKRRIFLRIPYWLEDVVVKVNGQEIEREITEGYLELNAVSAEVVIECNYQIPILKWQAHPNVKSSYGKVAFQRGPFIYTAEEADNGKDLHLFRVTGEAQAEPLTDPAFGTVTSLVVPAEKRRKTQIALYQLHQAPAFEPATLRLIPYYCWANRETGEMRVWLEDREG